MLNEVGKKIILVISNSLGYILSGKYSNIGKALDLSHFYRLQIEDGHRS